MSTDSAPVGSYGAVNWAWHLEAGELVLVLILGLSLQERHFVSECLNWRQQYQRALPINEQLKSINIK